MRLKPLITTYLPQLGLFSSRSRGTGDKKKSSSYQLHSVQKGSAHADISAGNSRDYPYGSHNMDVEGRYGGGVSAGGSTDKILN